MATKKTAAKTTNKTATKKATTKKTAPNTSRLSRIPAEDYAPGPVRAAYAGMLNAAGNPTSLRAFLLSVEASFLGFPALGIVLALSLRYGWASALAFVLVGFAVGALLPWLWVGLPTSSAGLWASR